MIEYIYNKKKLNIKSDIKFLILLAITIHNYFLVTMTIKVSGYFRPSKYFHGDSFNQMQM